MTGTQTHAARVYTAVGSTSRILGTTPGLHGNPAEEFYAIAKLDLDIDGRWAEAGGVDGSCLLRGSGARGRRRGIGSLDAHSQARRSRDSPATSPTSWVALAARASTGLREESLNVRLFRHLCDAQEPTEQCKTNYNEETPPQQLEGSNAN